MLYTRAGDTGTTKDFNSPSGERKSKSSCQTEALGALDELGAFLGLVKLKAGEVSWVVDGITPFDIVLWVQNNLFTIQAEVAGADKHIEGDKVSQMEKWIDHTEKELPPITTFFISGGTELAALFDVARTLARTAERRVVAGADVHEFSVAPPTLSFLNRLSSLLYALARLTNHISGITEQPPTYR
jgi:cob(I)alamin adenosyltransferase